MWMVRVVLSVPRLMAMLLSLLDNCLVLTAGGFLSRFLAIMKPFSEYRGSISIAASPRLMSFEVVILGAIACNVHLAVLEPSMIGEPADPFATPLEIVPEWYFFPGLPNFAVFQSDGLACPFGRGDSNMNSGFGSFKCLLLWEGSVMGLSA
ncbi:hypothetical protein HAX54_002625 [Datura stramonium]|uniref:Cytochrome b/b6 C-terminal region profile domain-containing protein n=1 Tax=Datura stramonium TaxID=4076 RepID=A0ABS8T472_DATST|nr:hypothetical protein [Datura stramonium]